MVLFNGGKARAAELIVRLRIIGWGSALLPPITALALDRHNFITRVDVGVTGNNGNSVGQSDPTGEISVCWINMGSSLKWFFLVPVILAALVGGVCTTMIVQSIRRSKSHEFYRSAVYTGWVMLSLSSVTGLAWIFAVLVIVTEETAFSYLFAIFATSQGAAIFYFHVRVATRV